MKKQSKIIVLLLALLALAPLANAQPDANFKAQLYFKEADKLYNSAHFEEALDYVQKAERQLGQTNARLLNLKIKSLYSLGRFIKAKKAIDLYAKNYMQGSNSQLNEDTMLYYVKIEEAAEVEAVEAKAKARAKAKAKKAKAEKATQELLNIKWSTANLSQVQQLLDDGADVNARDEDQWSTPLHYAAWTNKNPAIISALVKAGADVNARNKDQSNTTALCCSAQQKPSNYQCLS